jgi:putative membrane protein
MLTTRMMAAALAAALAMPAAAQASREAEEQYRRGTGRALPGQAQPAPAPAPGAQGQAQATGQPVQGQAQLTEEQRSALTAMHYQSLLATQIGEMAASRGASKEVQNLGRSLSQDHRRIDGELATLLKERGADINALPEAANRPQLEGQLRQLESKSGEEFDREFVSFLTRNGVAFVDAVKRARDVTPGKDARLKKFLDDAENEEEGHLAAARQLKSQRQARTPPAR